VPNISGVYAANDLEYAAVSEHAAGRGLTVAAVANDAVAERVKALTADFEQQLERLVPDAYRKATVEERVALIAQLKAIANR
jgi:hypothetical protein